MLSEQDLTESTDTALVLAIGRYHQTALAEIYRRHGGSVYALARRVLLDDHLAEEVTQEVFLRLWDAPDRYDPGRGALRTFLLGEAHSRAVDVVRSEDSRRRRDDKDAKRQAESGYDVGHEVVDLTVAEAVHTAMSELPVGERRAIELAYFGGYTYREVATLLEEPEGTVKTRIRTGLRRLRAHLGEAGYREDG